MRPAKVSLEILCHFQCAYCAQWWSIADYKPEPNDKIFCPACGEENAQPDRILTGDDFQGGRSTMSNKNSLPQVGQYYRHFKGNHYQIVHIGIDYEYALKDGEELYYWENGEHVEFLAASDITEDDTIVFYRGANGKSYARSLTNFLEVIGDEVEHQYPRFELIEEGDRNDQP